MQEILLAFSPCLRTFRRQAFLIISFASTTTIIALLLSLKDSNTYVSSFRLLLEPVNYTARLSQASALTRTEGLPDEDLLNLDYPTQLEILKSSLIMSKISQEVKTKLPKSKASSIDRGLQENFMVERITIGPSRYDWTKIFEVTYQDTDPEIVQAVAKATANQYLQYSLEERQNSINSGVKFIDEQLPKLEKRVVHLQSRQQELQQNYNLIDPSERGQELFSQLDEISQQKSANESELLELKTLAYTLQGQLNLTPKQAVVALALNQNPNHREILRQLQVTEGKIAAESARFNPGSPHVLTLKEDKENMLALLKQKAKPILEQHKISVDDNILAFSYQNESLIKLTQQLIDTHNQIKVLQVRGHSLQTSKKALNKPAQELPAIARQYKKLEQDLALTTQILNQLLTQRETLKVEAAQKDVPWKLLSKADITRDENNLPLAFSPNRPKKILAGLILGISGGMGIAILLEKRRDIFYTAEDIQDLLLLPLLGKIPVDDRFKTVDRPDSNFSALAFMNANNKTRESLFLKSFESLYAELTFLYADNPISSLVVSSVEPKDGQSTVALQLAKTAAAEGKKVLFVDANVDQPQTYTQFDLPPYRKLGRGLKNSSVVQEVICRVPGIDNLYILTANALRSECSTKLWSMEMQHIMGDLSTNYDLVIYDAPHFLNSPDVSFMAAQTDGILMVIGVEKTSQSLVREAMDQINSFRLTNLGVVANHLS
ncbi:AAA family ATPase [Waterburya agarophytonicola K14]|uniref:non-specific protein-tyrosine kinase n=1 Tax=Waterburya agarophytonicola KI4 TaxID=2874699 RepID=A0A964BVE7_9CYAN|nr:tyrosine-protein kinase domain-containing protein [Waterburya agarophytonicola]MCC0178505.1 AAA family ATPase [Waterburya agarophytonicola KI4]